MRSIIYCLLFLPLFGFAQTYDLIPMTSGVTTSLRGMSIVSDQVAWVSGSNGHIGRTVDGGKNWDWIKPEGYEKLDFRDIEAFDADKAIAVNAGSPAYILMTVDGGKTWKESYKNLDTAIFLDGMGFWNDQRGIVFGDPINSKMQLLRTIDGGVSWSDISENLQAKMGVGEAAFAASGSTIQVKGNGKVWIATGGTTSNIYYSSNFGSTWQIFECPILQGESSTGPFSMSFFNEDKGVVVGGNYLKDKENENNVLLTNNGGKTWTKPEKPVDGYRSGVTYINEKTLIAAGTSGIDISSDGGKYWYNISGMSFNVVQKSKKGDLILLAGNKGQIYQLVITAK
ncbi:WD40/YVTN/BNR-like repeat-containing protein [Pedobacter steynii]|uniref:Oxidoreductase n=1 Tax=Pedobacter steynii TaxID=430522 RepID=A0A1D7QIV6_9SPHI|nr:oxidoreductase [Pedobacter steynii]AOM78602.1 oxidoreductase [Pedobacter steynii]